MHWSIRQITDGDRMVHAGVNRTCMFEIKRLAHLVRKFFMKDLGVEK